MHEEGTTGKVTAVSVSGGFKKLVLVLRLLAADLHWFQLMLLTEGD